MLHVYHQGKHECHVKPNVYENDDYINQAIEESGGAMDPKQLAFAQMTNEMTRQQTNGEINMKAIVNIATQKENCRFEKKNQMKLNQKGIV